MRNSKLFISNAVFNTAESTRIELVSANVLSLKVNSANIMTISEDRIVVTANMAFGANISPVIPANTRSGSISITGNMSANGTANFTGNTVFTNSIMRISTALVASGPSVIRKNDKVLEPWQLINVQAVSAVTNVSSPSLAGYRAIRFRASNITVSTDNTTLRMRLSNDGGVTFITANVTSGFGYYAMDIYNVTNGVSSEFGSTAQVSNNSISCTENAGGQGQGSAAGDGGAEAEITFVGFDSVIRPVSFFGTNNMCNNGGFQGGDWLGGRVHIVGGLPYNMAQIFVAAGTWTGTVYWEGMR